MTYYHIVSLLTIAALLLGGCGKKLDEEDPYQGTTEKALFAKAQQSMMHRDFDDAIKMFESFDVQYPLSLNAPQALMEYIYAQFKLGEYDIMQAAADRFIRLYPYARHVDYVYYIKGVAATMTKRSFFDRYFAVNIAYRDGTFMSQAYDDFATLVKRFPRSVYAPDTRRRMIYIRNLLAEAEIVAAEQYLKQSAYVAAANRAMYVVQTFVQAPQVERALEILIMANRELGLDAEARSAEKILKLNFAKSSFLKS